MTAVSLGDYRQGKGARIPRQIVFFSPQYTDREGANTVLNIVVNVANGDVEGQLAVVAADGGVGRVGDDGVFRFLPWPCAAVEIRDIE